MLARSDDIVRVMRRLGWLPGGAQRLCQWGTDEETNTCLVMWIVLLLSILLRTRVEKVSNRILYQICLRARRG